MNLNVSNEQIQFTKNTLARKNLVRFTEALGYKNAQFQVDWYNFLQNSFSPLEGEADKVKRYVQLWPRGHSKTQCAINYMSWLVGNNPDIHISIVTKTAVLSQDILLALLTRFESNQKFKEIFGELKPKITKRWKSDSIIINRKEVDNKNPTIAATSMFGSNIGRRNDLIIGDDLIDAENVQTEGQIHKTSDWFHRILMPTLQPWGACLVVGTRWHYADLYNELVQKWPHDIKRAIINDSTQQVLWSEFMPYEELIKRQQELGSITFQCQYQNDPTGMEGDLLRSEWLHSWDTAPSTRYPKFAGVDPALGEGDLASIATLAYDREANRGYLTDVWADRVPFSRTDDERGKMGFLQKLLKLHEIHEYSKIYIEANAFQKILTYLPEFKGLPIVNTQTTKNKEQRFIPMSSHFEAKRVLVNPNLNEKSEFWTEWVQFPRGQHDDALDAVEIVTREVIGERRRGFFF